MNLTLDPTATGFSLANARACARYAGEVYKDAQIQSELSHVTLTELVEPRCLVIAYRGTANLRDWITDANVKRISIGAGGVHRGFQEAFQSTVMEVAKMLQTGCGILPIFVTGHSLGGAQAVLCARSLQLTGHDVRCYTFGQPRVGDSAFARDCDRVLSGRHFRIINGEDVVARIPAWLAGFRHSGERCLLNSFGSLDINPPWWTMGISDAWGLFREWLRSPAALAVDVFTDHHMEGYITQLDLIHELKVQRGTDFTQLPAAHADAGKPLPAADSPRPERLRNH